MGADHDDGITEGDAAILRFLAAAEILETDLWEQYNELGGVGAPPSGYQTGLIQLDGDMPQYIADNTDDELSHELFINAYLKSKGAKTVDLDKFRNLLGSQVTDIPGIASKKRLTNLMELTVDTSWWSQRHSEPRFRRYLPECGSDAGRRDVHSDSPKQRGTGNRKYQRAG
jgi:hypothetical protein